MLTLTLPPELERALTDIAAKSGRPSASIAEEAIARAVEDWGDYLEAREIMKANYPAQTATLARMRQALGLYD